MKILNANPHPDCSGCKRFNERRELLHTWIEIGRYHVKIEEGKVLIIDTRGKIPSILYVKKGNEKKWRIVIE